MARLILQDIQADVAAVNALNEGAYEAGEIRERKKALFARLAASPR